MVLSPSPTVDQMTQNILSHFQASTDETRSAGMAWYDVARSFADELASDYGCTLAQAACVISAHSKNCRWNENMRRARLHLSGSPVGFSDSIRMANGALSDSVNPFQHIVGPKIQPFAHNVAGNEDMVATDRWAQRAAFDSFDDVECARLIKRVGVRDDMISAYRKAAAEAGVSPAVMQAIVWVHVRGSAE